MKTILITGDHPRHLYFADKFVSKFEELGIKILWAIEKRESFIPIPDKDLDLQLKKLFELHFEKRAKAEELFFGKNAGRYAKSKIKKIININPNDLMNGNFLKICDDFKPDFLLSNGCHLISNEILNITKICNWNIHGGLSPWYKGGATHFWPTYLLEPEFTGITVHETTDEIDAGAIIHQEVVKLNKEDGIHENACRITRDFSENFSKLFSKKVNELDKIKGLPQKISGRNFTGKLWKPSMLKVIYELFDDRINQYCIENKLMRKPKVISIL